MVDEGRDCLQVWDPGSCGGDRGPGNSRRCGRGTGSDMDEIVNAGDDRTYTARPLLRPSIPLIFTYPASVLSVSAGLLFRHDIHHAFDRLKLSLYLKGRSCFCSRCSLSSDAKLNF